MGKSDAKKAEKKAKKRARKEAKKEAKRLKKEAKKKKKEEPKKRREKQAQNDDDQNHQPKHNVAIQEESPTELQQKNAINEPKQDKDTLQGNRIFFKKRIEVSLSLLPAAMKDIMMAIRDSIRSMIFQYTAKVGGVLMTFENIQIISNSGHGKILNELPYLHYKVSFDGLVFCPRVGCKLQGAVTESFPSHLGILVLGYFNTMIPASCMNKAGFFYGEDVHEWSKEDGSSVFNKDDKVDFIVDKIHESVGTLSMEGSAPSRSLFASKAKAAASAQVDEEA